MKSLWKRLIEDETGVVISSELVLVGTVGVLGTVVGLEAVSTAVNQELNDLAQAFGAVSQSYNVRSIAKLGHARVAGFGFNDFRGNSTAIVQGDVAGSTSAGFGVSGSTVINSGVVTGSTPFAVVAPVVQTQVLRERVIGEVISETVCPTVAAPVSSGQIIEEHIIRRRVVPDCGPIVLPAPSQKQVQPVPSPAPEPKTEPVETKTKKKGV